MISRYQILDLESTFRSSGEHPIASIPESNYEVNVLKSKPIAIGDTKNLFALSSSTLSPIPAFMKAVKNASKTKIGYYELKDIVILGAPGLILDPCRKVIWFGKALGWSLERLKSCLISQFGIESIGNSEVFIDEKKLLPIKFGNSIDAGELISAPGYAVYGHWLLDVIPRLYCVRHCENITGIPLLAPKPLPWANDFIQAMGYRLEDFHQLIAGQSLFVRTLKVHALARSGFVLDRDLSTNAWSMLIKGLMEKSTETKLSYAYNCRIFVSRSLWLKKRWLRNSEMIHAFLTANGYSIVCPEKYSLTEQMRIFSAAETVIGEDGSGLHNIIYSSQPNGRLGVINMGRTNLWHAGISLAKGWSLAYADATPADQDSDILDLSKAKGDKFDIDLEEVEALHQTLIN